MASLSVFGSFFIIEASQEWGRIFVQPLAIGFQANQEMQGRKIEREIQHEAISQGIVKSSHAMWNSKGQQLQEKFRALFGVHYIHTIYRFKAQEVRSLML